MFIALALSAPRIVMFLALMWLACHAIGFLLRAHRRGVDRLAHYDATLTTTRSPQMPTMTASLR